VKTSSWDKRATSSGGWPAAFAVLVGCGGSKGAPPADPPGVTMAALRPALDFSFDAVDEPAVTAEATRGMPTVISFITTSSLPSQAQVDFLVAMAKHDGDRVHYAVVLLESEENRELAQLYKKALSIPFPVAIADPQTLAGASGFGDVSTVPVTVLLDRAGRLVWRMEGRVVKSDEMRAAMRGL
jgi:hypothetical protein